jgi:hypothetical protein
MGPQISSAKGNGVVVPQNHIETQRAKKPTWSIAADRDMVSG